MLQQRLFRGRPAAILLAVTTCSNVVLADPVPSFQRLGDLPGGAFSSGASAVSADGLVVVGSSASSTGTEAFCWTASGGMVGLGYLPSATLFSTASGVSGDGSVVVGSSRFTPGSSQLEAFRWTETGMVGLGVLPDAPPAQFRSNAYGVSVDGATVVGEAVGYGSSTENAFRWTALDGMVPLREPGLGSQSYGVSPDGGVIVGNAHMAGSSTAGQAFRWTAADGMVGLGVIAGGQEPSAARAVSGDGWVIVGESRSPNAGGSSFREAFCWTPDAGMVGLGDLPGGQFHSLAKDVSADGSIVIGSGTTALGSEAFIWNETAGMRSLQELLLNDLGLDLGGFTSLLDATGISDDGITIVGSGINADGHTEAFIATIPEPSTALLVAIMGLAAIHRRRQTM